MYHVHRDINIPPIAYLLGLTLLFSPEKSSGDFAADVKGD